MTAVDYHTAHNANHKEIEMKQNFTCGVIAVVFAASLLANAAQVAAAVDVEPLVRTINQVSAKGGGHREAIAAWSELAKADVDQITEILAGMDENNRLAVNWVRAAVESIAQKHVDRGESLPIADLKGFIADTTQSPKARRTAFEMIRSVDEQAANRLVPGFLNDSSLELRRDAVALTLQQAEAALSAGDKDAATASFRTALNSARDLDQVKKASGQLRELGQTVDLPSHFGFVMKWKLIGPFENTDNSGFDVAYGPEKSLDLTATYPGKDGEVKWIDHTTEDEFGMVDLNEALGKFKGAIAYAYAEFQSESDRDVELRLGCVTGNKVWLNGQLLMANNVYHSGSSFDQYKAEGRLKKGVNTILLKIGQNEQTESWAQRWEFQLRVCDKYGTGLTSQ